MTLGNDGLTTITESLRAYNKDHYRVTRHSIIQPEDTDQDGADDMIEWSNRPGQNPLNAAKEITSDQGLILLDDFSNFQKLSVKSVNVQWSEFLNGKEYVKFIIVDGLFPSIYFINTNNYDLHSEFADKIGIDILSDDIIKGQVIYHPTTISTNGNLGSFTFNYSNGREKEFKIVQKTYELLGANMPFLKNNLSYFVTQNSEDKYWNDIALYNNSRVYVLLEKDLYRDIDYWGLNEAEGYGLLKHMTLDEIPGPRDIVLYESLPNSLPRVGGIITSVIQTPLSHVNLRALQNNIPNAYIRDALENDTINSFIDKYIYYKVEQNNYTIREAELSEVNEWYEFLRPKEIQYPPLDPVEHDILPLDEIEFNMSAAFGAKCTNIATMRTFGFDEGTVPNGYGVPFNYYVSFMEYNNLYDRVSEMISDESFHNDRDERDTQLKQLRREIKDADMPEWMMDELEWMHNQFPTNTSIRCRSSSNNEDLPGFNGAGLYDSKTQHPDEGHISKSIKQVYASLWNLRAFEERDFHRVDHFSTAMGVLCHPNYSDEKANGVGISTDPLYDTEMTFYLNTQIGEDLITNPENNSVPEEILLDNSEDFGYIIVQNSNLVPAGTAVISDDDLQKLRDYLLIIHNEFQVLYEAENDPNFAMDIEYKITKDDILAIKQARPWTNAIPAIHQDTTELPISKVSVFPNPTSINLFIEYPSDFPSHIYIVDQLGRWVQDVVIDEEDTNKTSIYVGDLPSGVYYIIARNEVDGYSEVNKFLKY